MLHRGLTLSCLLGCTLELAISCATASATEPRSPAPPPPQLRVFCEDLRRQVKAPESRQLQYSLFEAPPGAPVGWGAMYFQDKLTWYEQSCPLTLEELNILRAPLGLPPLKETTPPQAAPRPSDMPPPVDTTPPPRSPGIVPPPHAPAPLPPPVYAPPRAPVPAPIPAPPRAPVPAPVPAPPRAPVSAPPRAPVPAPIPAPPRAPVPAPVPAPPRAAVPAPPRAPLPTPPRAPVPVPVAVWPAQEALLSNQVPPGVRGQSYVLAGNKDVAQLRNDTDFNDRLVPPLNPDEVIEVFESRRLPEDMSGSGKPSAVVSRKYVVHPRPGGAPRMVRVVTFSRYGLTESITEFDLRTGTTKAIRGSAPRP